MKGFTKDGKFRPTGNKAKSSISKKDIRYKKSADKPKKDPEELKQNKLIKANAKEFDVSVDVVRELQNQHGDDVFIENTTDGDGVNGEATGIQLDDGSEWLLFKDHDELRDEALEDVKQLLDDIGVEGINGYESYVKASDASQVASEMADSQMDGEEDEIRNEVESEVKDEIEEPEDEDDGKYDLAYEKWEAKVEAEIELRLETAIEDRRSEIASDIEDEIESDPVHYFVHELGYEDAKTLLDAGLITVDEDKLAEYVVDTDGAEHSIARYDGNSYDTDDGQILIRVN